MDPSIVSTPNWGSSPSLGVENKPTNELKIQNFPQKNGYETPNFAHNLYRTEECILPSVAIGMLNKFVIKRYLASSACHKLHQYPQLRAHA